MKHAIFTIILFSILIPLGSSAQSSQVKRADQLYQNLSFNKAADIYESLHKKYPQNGKYIQRLAYCFDKMLDYKRALLFYSYLVQLDEKKVEDYYDYARLLRINGDIEQSKIWLEKYIQLAPYDKRAISQLSKLNDLINFKRDFKQLEVKEVSGNTRFVDMCPIYYQDRLVYSSAKDSFSMVRNKFQWDDQPFLNLYETKPNPKDDFIETTELSSKLTSRVHEGPACFSSDFKTIYFTRNSNVGGKGQKTPNGVNNLKIYISSFNGKDWSDPQGFQYNSNTYSVGHPALSPDNNTLYFVSDMPGGIGKTDLYKCEMAGGRWSDPVNLGPTINTEGKEMFPFVDKNGVLYFSSDGHPGIAGLDIYAAKELEKGNFMVSNLGNQVNSKYDDFGFIINTDSLTGYFTSNRPGGAGSDDIYSFAVSAVTLSVTSMNYSTKEIMPEAKVYLYSDDGEAITSALSDQDGKVEFGVKPGMKYQLSAEKGNYIAEKTDVDVKSELFGLKCDEDVLLTQGYPYLTIDVIDKETGLIITNALVDISSGAYVESELEDNNGILKMRMNEETDYTFYATAEEYFESTVQYTSKGKGPGKYTMTIELEQISEGKQFTLDDLFYDLNKYNVRPDAAIVLDRLAKILTDNPEIRIEIGSHTDCRGTAESNMVLSQRRSESVMAYLLGKGISKSRLVAKGYGETQLINRCADGVDCPEEEHQENRRTVIEILNKEFKKVKRGSKNVFYF
ncbi:MAG: OmpA family protein [Prolixibacteraceae bacterium]